MKQLMKFLNMVLLLCICFIYFSTRIALISSLQSEIYDLSKQIIEKKEKLEKIRLKCRNIIDNAILEYENFVNESF